MSRVFKRVLLKLSGEALAAGQGFGVDVHRVHEIAGEIADVHALGVQIAIVVGGGNFFRGVAAAAMNIACFILVASRFAGTSRWALSKSWCKACSAANAFPT